MKDIKLKRLTLFLLESIILQDNPTIDEGFASQFNFFIEKYYEDNKDLFSIIYEPQLLEECIKNEWEILPLEQMISLIKKYYRFEGYGTLIDEVGPEIDQKLIQLATLFTEYHNSLMKLYYADSSIYYPKGYAKILNKISNWQTNKSMIIYITKKGE